MLYEIFDEVLNEVDNDFRNNVVNFLKNDYPEAEIVKATSKSFDVTNMGSRAARDNAIMSLKNRYKLQPTKQKGGSNVAGRFPNGDVIELFQGISTAGKISNKGDVAEGILGAAILAAFKAYNEKKRVTPEKIKKVIDELNLSDQISTTKKKKGRSLETTFLDINGSQKPITLKVVLNKGNYDDFVDIKDRLKLKTLEAVYANIIRYVNSNYFRDFLNNTIGKKSRANEDTINNFSIEVVGAEDQRGSKADLKILGDGKQLKSYSMKKDSRQLGQVGGKTFENVAAWMNKIFGVDMSKFTEEYMQMLQAPDRLTYYNLVEEILKDIKQVVDLDLNSQDEQVKKKKVVDLLNALKYAAIKDDSNIDLLNLEKNKFRMLNVSKIIELIDDIDIETSIQRSGEGPPYLRLFVKSDDLKGKEAELFQVRPKAESSGTFRIYLEYGNFIDKALSATTQEE